MGASTLISKYFISVLESITLFYITTSLTNQFLFQTGTIYRSAEFKEGFENVFTLLNYMEKVLSQNKAEEEIEDSYFDRWQDRIVGGVEAYSGQFPFIASLKIKSYNR